MESPIEKIKEWYLSLPVEQRVDIGALVGSICLDINILSISSDEIVNKFVEKIEKSQSSNMQEVGMALVLRSGIEFFFINKRKNEAMWKSTKSYMQEMASRENSEKFDQLARQVDFLAKQWICTCDKWSEIKRFLTDEYLEKYSMCLGN